jgi:hypothetical protein
MRPRKLWLGLGIVASVLVLFGVTAIYLLSPRSYQWHEVVSADNQFRVQFPGAITTSQQVDKSATGKPFAAYNIKSSPTGRVVYAVNWWENPDRTGQTTEELFAHFRQCGVNVFHAVAMSKKDGHVQGHPAEYTFYLAESGLMVGNLAVRVGPRVYSLWVADPSLFQEKENTQRFFKSFTLQ